MNENKLPENNLEFALSNLREFKNRNAGREVVGAEFFDTAVEQVKRGIEDRTRLSKLLDRAFESAIAPLGAGVEIEPSAEIEDLAMEIYRELEKENKKCRN